MTDEQIVKFILHKATISGRELKLHDPRLMVCIRPRYSQAIYLTLKFANSANLFFIRFTNGSTRGVFKMNMLDDASVAWKNALIEKFHRGEQQFSVEYDVNDAPASVKHQVSYTIIEALKTKGMGLDAISIEYSNSSDIMLIQPSESYEEAVIEADLCAFSI